MLLYSNNGKKKFLCEPIVMNKHNDIYSRDYISYYIDSEKYTKSVTVYRISASATGTSAIPHN